MPDEKNEKVIGQIKDELDGQITKKFVGLRAKPYCCVKDNNDEDKMERIKKRIRK